MRSIKDPRQNVLFDSFEAILLSLALLSAFPTAVFLGWFFGDWHWAITQRPFLSGHRPVIHTPGFVLTALLACVNVYGLARHFSGGKRAWIVVVTASAVAGTVSFILFVAMNVV